MALFHTCKPLIICEDGADHGGDDWFLRCDCGREGSHYIEVGDIKPPASEIAKLWFLWLIGQTEKEAG